MAFSPSLLLRRIYPFPRHKTTVLAELSGSVGDLGTFIPIVLSLTLTSHLDLFSTLLFSSAFNLLTAFLFLLPVPLQPMKSIAAASLARSPPFSTSQIAAAGISTSAVLLFLGSTGLMSLMYRYLPLPVVRGIQLSQGLNFAFSGIKYVRYNQEFETGKSRGDRPWLGFDGLVLALSALVFLVLSTGSGDSPANDISSNRIDDPAEDSEVRLLSDQNIYPIRESEVGQSSNVKTRISRRIRVLSSIPAALLVFLLGLVLCFVRDHGIFGDLEFGPSRLQLLRITWDDWKVGFIEGAIPQIPLSVLNSVIAVCKLSGDLFPGREMSATSVSVSVGVMNLVGCWFGAMPMCHGAGGLAGQYKFGARTGWSIAFLGLGKLVVGLVFGNSFARILKEYPIGILGVLLMFAGIELAMAARDMNTKEEAFVMLVCAAVSLTGSSAALGFGVGIVLFLLLKLRSLDLGCLGSKRAGE
ncbi:hypothetical protein MLD38_005591 [Melastoma candidum]|uniref:Uncharacterized protein n=1 Tax=Melastoma candidum TaxID=119954 RepID=A0ACB9RJQ7_9MYRT|nr:hypothetical protein MLD38_005591 [Melastoma candidum]